MLFPTFKKCYKYFALTDTDELTQSADKMLWADTATYEEEYLNSQDISVDSKAEIGWTKTQKPAPPQQQVWHLVCSLAIFMVSVVAVLVMQQNIDGACLGLMEPWNPLSPFVSYESKRFEWGSCPDNYCGDIQNERESSWKELWDYGWIGFPREMINKLDKSPELDWLHSLEPGQNVTLVSLPEFVHQIHCVGRLRKTLYGVEEHHQGQIDDLAVEKLRLHANHCLLSLKNMVECKADGTPVVFEESEGGSRVGAWTLRDTPKRCKNFHKLRDALAERPICSSGCNADEIYSTVKITR